VVTLAGSTLDGVFDDIGNVAAAAGVADRGARLIDALRDRLRAVHLTLKTAAAPRPRVVVIEWTDPPYAAGHWVPEMIGRAGGIDVLAKPGEHSRQVTADAVRVTDPGIVLVAPCGVGLARAAGEARALMAYAGWDWMRGRAVWALDANSYLSRPGPRLVDGVELMARIFNPALFTPIDPGYAERIE
jgi:iron complex transport system substrate-binding protein